MDMRAMASCNLHSGQHLFCMCPEECQGEFDFSRNKKSSGLSHWKKPVDSVLSILSFTTLPQLLVRVASLWPGVSWACELVLAYSGPKVTQSLHSIKVKRQASWSSVSNSRLPWFFLVRMPYMHAQVANCTCQVCGALLNTSLDSWTLLFNLYEKFKVTVSMERSANAI